MSPKDIITFLSTPLIRKLIIVVLLGLSAIAIAANADLSQNELDTILSIIVTLCTLSVGILVAPLGSVIVRRPGIYRRRK